MPVAQIQLAVGTTVTTASSLAGWGATTPCSYGILVSNPATNAGTVYYGYAATASTVNGMPIPNGVPYTINPNGLTPSTGNPPRATLSNLWIVATTSGTTFAAEAQG